jgi:hypothetical protein
MLFGFAFWNAEDRAGRKHIHVFKRGIFIFASCTHGLDISFIIHGIFGM